MRNLHTTLYSVGIAIILAALGGCTETYRWEEEVATHNGDVIRVKRQAEFNSGPMSRLEGGGGNVGDEIEFKHGSKTVRWKHPKSSIPINRASILDIVDGEPVIVVPISTYEDCHPNDYPLEGYVAFGWRGGKWNRLDSQMLPPNLKENLLSTYDMRESQASPYLGRLVTIQTRPEVQRDRGRERTLQAITNAPDRFDQSCRRFRPPANPAADAINRAVVDGLASAPTLPAVVATIESASLAFTREQLTQAMGDRVYDGVPVRNCVGIVASVRHTAATTSNRGSIWSSPGQEIALADRSSAVDTIRIPKEHWTSVDWSIPAVFCVDSTIYALTRRSRESIALLRFPKKGQEFGGMVLVDLPRPQSLNDKDWLTVFAPNVQDEKLTFFIARNFDYQARKLIDGYEVAVDLPESWRRR